MEPGESKPNDPERTKREELERELDRGEHPLPDNRPRGILGGIGLDLRQRDPERPSLFGGVTQEIDANVVWILMLLAFLVFFPAAYAILWWYPRFSTRMKVGYTIGFTVVLMVVGAALAFGWLRPAG